MVIAGPVSLYRLPQDVFLRIELDSFSEAGLHVFYLLALFLSILR